MLPKSWYTRNLFHLPKRNLSNRGITIVEINKPSQSIDYTREPIARYIGLAPLPNPQCTAIQHNTIKQTHLTRQSKTHPRTIWKYVSRLAAENEKQRGLERLKQQPLVALHNVSKLFQPRDSCNFSIYIYILFSFVSFRISKCLRILNWNIILF